MQEFKRRIQQFNQLRIHKKKFKLQKRNQNKKKENSAP